MQSKFNKQIIIIIICYLIAVSAGIFYNYNLPNTVGDESTLMSAGLKMIAEKTLRPAFDTNYYFPFASYVYLPFIAVILALDRILFFDSTAELISFGITDFAKFLPYVRLANIFYGAVCVYILYHIAEKLFSNRRASLLAAFLFSTSLLFVQMSHFARVWVPQILFILLAFNSIIDYYQKAQTKLMDYLKPALWTTLAFGTHLVGVLVYFSFLAAHLIKNKKENIWRIIFQKNFLIAGSALILTVPLLYWLNPYGFENYVAYLSGSTDLSVVRQTSFNLKQGIAYYPQILLEYEPFLLILVMYGFYVLFKNRMDIAYLMAAFILPYYLVIGPLFGSSHAEPRYILPVVPFMALAGAYGLASIREKYSGRKTAIAIVYILLLLIVLLPAKLCYLFVQPSTRVMAAQWIYDNIPSGSSIIDYDLFLQLNENKETFASLKMHAPYFYTKKRLYLDSQPESDLPQPNYYVFYPEIFDPIPDALAKKDYDYVILQWWNEAEYQKEYNLVKRFGIALGEQVKTFPEDLDIKKERPDIANNMRSPYKYLLSANESGPNIAVYKVD